MSKGHKGRVLRVDLSAGTCKSEALNAEWAKAYLGGRGLATKYLVEEVAAGSRSDEPGEQADHGHRAIDRHLRRGQRPLHGGDQVAALGNHRQLQLRRLLPQRIALRRF